jgi:hypothetical protein
VRFGERIRDTRSVVSGLSEVGGTDGSELRLAICLDPVAINSVSLQCGGFLKDTSA